MHGFEKFYKTEHFANRIKDTKGVFYAHNGGRFDFVYLAKWLSSHMKIRLINNRLASAHLGEAVLRDSFCIFPESLDKYQKDKIDYAKFEKKVRRHHMPEIEKYLEGDCKYLYELVDKWREEYGSNLTIASTGFAFWRKKCDIPAFRTTSNFYDKFHDFYFGGRVEAFKKGVMPRKEWKVYDINSAYPHAMRHDHAWGKDYQHNNGWPPDLERAFLKFKSPSVGAFPLRDKTKIWFPADGEIREFSCTGWEVKAALDTGALSRKDFKSMEYWQFFASMNFTKYVDHFYEIKRGAKKGTLDYLFAKLLMNSLY
jgi:hypothetical protein